MKCKILIIIVTYNGEKWVSNIVDGINKSTLKLDTIIIDNGSTDKTLQLFEKKLKNMVKIVKNEKNLGFGAANNIGFEYAIKNNYDYVYLLNQDAYFFDDTVEKLVNLSNKVSDLGILSPFQCCAGINRVDYSFQINVCGYTSNSDIFSDLYFKETKEMYEVTNVMAAHWLIPVNVIRKVGGFSPMFFLYGEDDNYISRVRYFGYKVYIAPYINAIHDRYNRVNSVDKEIYLSYAHILKLFSSPVEEKNKILRLFANSFYQILFYRSLKPIKYLFKILINYSKIMKNRKISMYGKSPFLRIDIDKNT